MGCRCNLLDAHCSGSFAVNTTFDNAKDGFVIFSVGEGDRPWFIAADRWANVPMVAHQLARLLINPELPGATAVTIASLACCPNKDSAAALLPAYQAALNPLKPVQDVERALIAIAAAKGAKSFRVRDMDSLETYDSAKAACDRYGIDPAAMSRHLKRHDPASGSVSGHRFERII